MDQSPTSPGVVLCRSFAKRGRHEWTSRLYTRSVDGKLSFAAYSCGYCGATTPTVKESGRNSS